MLLRALIAGLAFAAAFAFLPSSASAQQAPACADVDWYAQGYTDAERNGSPEDATSRIGEHRGRCTGEEAIDQPLYETGFITGLADFCTPVRAFQLARGGGNYGGWCPAELAEAYAIGLLDGARVRRAEQAVSDIRPISREARARERESQNQHDMQPYTRDFAVIGRMRAFQVSRIETRMQQQVNNNRQFAAAEQAAEEVAVAVDNREAYLAELREEFGGKYGAW